MISLTDLDYWKRNQSSIKVVATFSILWWNEYSDWYKSVVFMWKSYKPLRRSHHREINSNFFMSIENK